MRREHGYITGHAVRMTTIIVMALTLVACAAPGNRGFHEVAAVAEFPTSLGQAAVLPLSADQLEVHIPGHGGFIVNGRDVVDIQVFPLMPVADGEVVLVATAYPGCSRDYYAITYGSWPADFYRVGDCQRPMQIGFEPATGTPKTVVIRDRSGQLRYGVDRRQMVRLDALAPTGRPPVPPSRPVDADATGRAVITDRAPVSAPSNSHAPAPSASPASPVPAARDFTLPPVGTLSIE